MAGDGKGGQLNVTGPGGLKVNLTGQADGGKVSVNVGGVKVDLGGSADGGNVNINVPGVKVNLGSGDAQGTVTPSPEATTDED